MITTSMDQQQHLAQEERRQRERRLQGMETDCIFFESPTHWKVRHKGHVLETDFQTRQEAADHLVSLLDTQIRSAKGEQLAVAARALFDAQAGTSSQGPRVGSGPQVLGPRNLWADLGEALYGPDDWRVRELRS